MHLAVENETPPAPVRAYLPTEHRAAATCYGSLAVAIMSGCFAVAFSIAAGNWATAGTAAVGIGCCVLAFTAAGQLYDRASALPEDAGGRRSANHPVYHRSEQP
jgi:hypothetical protein